ncbi:MAG TPA: flippase [Candidatus Saccharimonadales bacterium]|nr:flippase [Candidatus Saccharimonadales bacterium]
MSRKVAHNTLWNVGGSLASLGVGLLALPVLLHTLGEARMGVFTLALGLIGFSGLLDLGLGRALTQTVASSLGMGRPRGAVAALVWHVLRLLALFGLVWAVMLWWFIPPAVQHLFHLEGTLKAETVFGLRMVALSLPFALVATGAMGALEGIQAFRRVSTFRSLLSVSQFGLPTLAVLLKPDVGWAVAGLALSRVLSMIVWLHGLRREFQREKAIIHAREDLQHLLRFGGWLSLSNVIGPLMVYADRFYLASVFAPAQVAYYAVPYDAVFRLTSLPMTALNALFPALAEAQQRATRTAPLLLVAMRAMVSLLLPPLVLAIAFAMPLLTFWLGASFALHAVHVFQWLLLGVLLNSCAQVPYAALQAHGRADHTARLHLLELPLFAVMLASSVWCWGVEGAAIAWTLRVLLDALLLYVSAWWLQPTLRVAWSSGMRLLLIATAAAITALWLQSLTLRLILAIAVCIACSWQLLRLARQWREIDKRHVIA